MDTRNRQSAFDSAINLLSYKDRTEKQLYDKLKNKDYSDTEIDKAFIKLREYGYLNDERYANHYHESQVRNKGIRRIKLELLQKGISNNIVNEVLASNEYDEVSSILHIMEQRYSDADFSDEKQQRRIFGFFQRRGFSYDDIKSAVRIYAKNDKFQE